MQVVQQNPQFNEAFFAFLVWVSQDLTAVLVPRELHFESLYSVLRDHTLTPRHQDVLVNSVKSLNPRAEEVESLLELLY